MPDLSIALCLRDDETRLPEMARAAAEVASSLAAELEAGEWRDTTTPPQRGEREEATISGDLPLRHELLALDEGSRDNTLSVLSILHRKLPELRSIQDLPRGTAVRQLARTARGRVWLIVDAPFEVDRALWAARQVFCGDPAALIPGEVLAVGRNLGQAALGWHRGGLVSAQREVQAMLDSHGQHAAWSPPRDHGLRQRATLFVRGRLGRVGLGHFDRRR
ncbi:hypothetical protein PPSIR1_35992 [Plesiocystis pacifica SIR-1]|uniref:Uncharacterized protein n=1 Tax=Plesiocystis pacifica SIR-1 TaxID=391625 RepID=A6G1X7_9BACT|nr:hypothetical protein [Plesiocystis pacifica]EDM80167.1 hypothetical protein PPSIR1_35992 [Plesiocystis pacifica SIR-1]